MDARSPKTQKNTNCGLYVLSRVISRIALLITHIRGLIALLITTHGRLYILGP